LECFDSGSGSMGYVGRNMSGKYIGKRSVSNSNYLPQL